MLPRTQNKNDEAPAGMLEKFLRKDLGVASATIEQLFNPKVGNNSYPVSTKGESKRGLTECPHSVAIYPLPEELEGVTFESKNSLIAATQCWYKATPTCSATQGADRLKLHLAFCPGANCSSLVGVAKKRGVGVVTDPSLHGPGKVGFHRLVEENGDWGATRV